VSARQPARAGRQVAALPVPGLEAAVDLVRVRGRRHIQIRVSPEGRVEVRGPWRCTGAAARAALDRHDAWLRRTLARVKSCASARPPLGDGTRLPLLDHTLTLRLRNGSRTVAERLGDDLVVTGPTPDDAALRSTLVRWYRREAGARLVARLDDLAAPLGVRPARVAIRDQRTRWGSCSSRGTVSLNWRLLLLPGALADYVIVHELCHLHHLSHCRAFWVMVAGAVPDWQERRARLRSLGGTLPL
jgi:hypothetical protein